MVRLIMNGLKQTIVILCILAVVMTIVGDSAAAIKEEKGISQDASKKIGELNENISNYCDQLTIIKDEIKKLKIKVEGKSQRIECFLNNTIKEADNSMHVIDMLNDVSLNDSVINMDIQDDLKDISKNICVLKYLLKHCKFNQESNSLEFMESNEREIEVECCKLLSNKFDKINRDLENVSIENFLLQSAFKIRDGLNIIKNKIIIWVENQKALNKNKTNDTDAKNKKLFNKIDELYSNKKENVESKTVEIIDIIKKTFSKSEEARLRAMIAFDIINKYKNQGINREEIIKQLVEPVVKEEMELSLKRCCAEGGLLLSKKLYAANVEDSINLSIKLATNTEANSLYDFSFVAFYGTDVEYGFYDILNNDKKYWYNKYDQSKDCILCPIIIDIVELNSLLLRLEELEHVGIDADNVRKISKVFDKIFNDSDDASLYSAGMYHHLTTKRYGEKDCDEAYKKLGIGDDALLNELMDAFSGFVNEMSFNSGDESKVDIEGKLHGHIGRIKVVVNKIDEKYSKLAEDNPEFANFVQKNEFKKSRIDVYEHLLNLDLYKFAMNWDNLVFTVGTDLMYNFRKNKIDFKENKLTIDEFVTCFDQDKRQCIHNVLHIKKFKDRFRYLNELSGFFKYIGYDIIPLLPDEGIVKSIIYDDHDAIMKYNNNATDQDLAEMKEISHRAITDMKNIRQNHFILEHEQMVKRLEDSLKCDIKDKEFISEIARRTLAKNDEFRKYYEENRYDLSEEKIYHLKKLTDEFKELLLRCGL